MLGMLSAVTTLDDLYNAAVRRKAVGILDDEIHPLYLELKLLPSGGHSRIHAAKKRVFKGSFIHNAISVVNKLWKVNTGACQEQSVDKSGICVCLLMLSLL